MGKYQTQKDPDENQEKEIRTCSSPCYPCRSYSMLRFPHKTRSSRSSLSNFWFGCVFGRWLATCLWFSMTGSRTSESNDAVKPEKSPSRVRSNIMVETR